MAALRFVKSVSAVLDAPDIFYTYKLLGFAIVSKREWARAEVHTFKSKQWHALMLSHLQFFLELMNDILYFFSLSIVCLNIQASLNFCWLLSTLWPRLTTSTQIVWRKCNFWIWSRSSLYVAYLESQLRVTAAEPGRVDFELDIKKEHTVSCLLSSAITSAKDWAE